VENGSHSAAPQCHYASATTATAASGGIDATFSDLRRIVPTVGAKSPRARIAALTSGSNPRELPEYHHAAGIHGHRGPGGVAVGAEVQALAVPALLAVGLARIGGGGVAGVERGGLAEA
jgi:hypothetical protein